MTLILNEDRKKLSKGDQDIVHFSERYKDLVYLPEANFNCSTLLGWSAGGEEEILDMQTLIHIFDPERLSTSAAVFDQKKLQWMNGEYIKKAPPEKVIELALPHLIAAGRVAEDANEARLSWVKEIIQLYQEQLHYGAEIVELTDLF